MAGLARALILETELLHDAVHDLARIHGELARRHGAEFRALDRRIERLVEDPAAWSAAPLTTLEPGRFVLGVPPVVAEILIAARALGVRPTA